MLGCNFAPRSWSFCNGQLLSISQNTALFSLLGTNYGGNGTTNFGLPDLRSRTPMSYGQGPGLSNHVIGQVGGVENVSLLATEVPPHNHTAITTASQPCKTVPGNSDSPVGNFPASNNTSENYAVASNASMVPIAVTNTLANSGGGLGHDNLSPYLCVNFCIALQGIFPSRN